MLEIKPVRNDEDAKSVETLAWEFVAWLRDRYPERLDDIDAYLAGQKFTERMADCRVDYGPPSGETLMAKIDGRPVGILMLRDLGDGRCEMNRMFVRAEARGHGVARRLMTDILQVARDLHFSEVVLGALPRHHEALALYRSSGFVEQTRLHTEGVQGAAIHMQLKL